MFVSGIWKLAAMTGVVGVGLFAAYQAHKGMDKGVASAASPVLDDGETPSDAGSIDPPTDVPASTAPKDADPFGATGTNPFESSTAAQESPPRKQPDRSRTSSALDDEWSGDANSPPALAKPSAKSSSQKKPKTAKTAELQNGSDSAPRARVDFESDFGSPEQDPKASEKPASKAVQAAAFDDGQPEKLPDDLDALEAEILRRREQAGLKPPSPKRPQTGRRQDPDATSTMGDPALDQALSAAVESTQDPGNQADAQQNPVSNAAGTPPASDPFSTNPAFDGKTATHRKDTSQKETADDGASPPSSTPDSDPFDNDVQHFPATDERLKNQIRALNRYKAEQQGLQDGADGSAPAISPPPLPLLGPPTGLKSIPPAGDSDPGIPSRPSDPFSTSDDGMDNASPEPKSPPRRLPDDSGRRRNGNALPKEVPEPLDSPANDQPVRNDFPDPPPPRKPVGLRLPTEAPDSSDVIPAGNPPAPLNTSPEPRRLNPDPSSGPSNDDLIGDGTVSPTSPRGIQSPKLTIEKIAPKQGTLGEPLVYSVIIRNVGGSDAQQVVIEDRIPKGTELTGTSPRAELIDHKLIWKIGTLRPNEEKKISIRVIPRQEGPIGSVARVTFATEVAADIVVVAPQLAFSVNAPRQCRVGDNIELTFLLKNTGSAPATNVSVRDIVPEGLKHEAASDIECPIGRLEPGESREIVLAVTAVKPGRVTNRAILAGDAGIQQELESAINVVGELLALTRSGSNRIYVDRPAVFKNNVRNDGNSEVKQVRVSEIVPAGMEFVEASAGGRFDPVERAIYWNVGPLPPGAEAEVSAKLVARAPGAQQAKITASGPSGSAAGIKSDVDVVGRPELQIETVSRTGQIVVGDRLTSKIQLHNHGSAAAKNVVLSIRLPQELKLVEVRGQKYTVQNNVIKFDPIGAIVPKDAKAFEIVTEAIAEAETQINLEIAADHLTKAARRIETVQIASEAR